jgi:hypothetical protein
MNPIRVVCIERVFPSALLFTTASEGASLSYLLISIYVRILLACFIVLQCQTSKLYSVVVCFLWHACQMYQHHAHHTEVYDTEGRFVPEKFESLFSKFDRENKGGLSWGDLQRMILANMNIVDPVGWWDRAAGIRRIFKIACSSVCSLSVDSLHKVRLSIYLYICMYICMYVCMCIYIMHLDYFLA